MKIRNHFLSAMLAVLVMFAFIYGCGVEITDSTGIDLIGVPADLNATAADSEVTLTWESARGALYYNVYWDTSPGAFYNGEVIMNVFSPYVHEGLDNGQTYYYSVTAVSVIGDGEPSEEVSATPAVPMTLPGIPVNVDTLGGPGQITLSWDPVAGADEYNIYYNTWGFVNTGDSFFTNTLTMHIHNGLTNGTTYYYAVSANNILGEGGLSDEVSDTPRDLYENYLNKLTAPDAEDGDSFGYSVSIEGDYAIVGASNEGGDGTSRGAVYVYKRSDNVTWEYSTKLTASDTQDGDGFGHSVAIGGEYVVAGAPGEDGEGTGRGAAYVFHRALDGTWDSGVKLIANDAEDGDGFGASGVSIDGDYIIVGARYEDGAGTDRGAAYVFHRTDTNAWQFSAKLIASDAADNDEFGVSVSISGDYAIVGARNEDGAGTDRGAAYVFLRTDTNAWDTGTKLTAPDKENQDYLGHSVSISGDYAIVGAYYKKNGTGTDQGAAYVFMKKGTNTWDTGTKLVNPDLQNMDYFGVSVSISGEYAIVGARWEDGNGGFDRGAAYVYHRLDTDSWDTGTKLTAPDAQDSDAFGWSVSISGDNVIVGALQEDGESVSEIANRGAAYIFY